MIINSSKEGIQAAFSGAYAANSNQEGDRLHTFSISVHFEDETITTNLDVEPLDLSVITDLQTIRGLRILDQGSLAFLNKRGISIITYINEL